MELKTHYAQGIVSSWSNSKAHAELICTASPNTKTDAFDLQIFSVDITQRSKQLNAVGGCQYDSAFRCLSWDTYGQKEGTYPYGLIFGGMQNGSFTLWDPSALMGNQKNEGNQTPRGLLFEEQAEDDSFPIMCAEWNALKNNFLAFGSTSVLLADIGKNVSDPKIMSIGKKNPHEGSYVTSVSWNNEVNYIFASAGQNGLIALWDIKKNDSIFQFKDSPSSSSGNRSVSVAWSKSINTQIAVALDDEKKNQLQIWDLRNKKGPIIVIDKGHTKGINCIDWCETDPDLILTGGRDKKVICWDYNQDEEPISTKKIDSEIFDIKWSRKLPSIYSVVTQDKLSICSLDDKNLFSYVPKWHQVPAGASFNGNNNMVVYSQAEGNILQQYKINIKTKKQLNQELQKLERVLTEQDISEYQEIEGEEGQMWKILSLKSNQENDNEIYDFLGLNKDNIIKEVEKYTGKKRQSGIIENKKAKSKVNKGSKANYIKISSKEADDIFGNLNNFQSQKTQQEDDPEAQIKYDMVPRNSNWAIGKEKLIKENMLIGNYNGAIDAAIKCGRTAQALIIAYSVDVNTFNSTLKTFFTETTDNFISDILKHIAFKDNEELVKKYDLDKWRECIALIFSISSLDKRAGLLKLLAMRIIEDKKQDLEYAAIYCNILAQDFDAIVDFYYDKICEEKSNSLKRKIVVAKLGTYLLSLIKSTTKNVRPSTTFEKIMRELAFICLQNNYKLLSHQIFNTYLPNSSQRYIQYLINNTEELSHLHKNNNQSVITLPVMQKKQQKKERKVQDSQAQHPTNIKPKRIKPVQIQETEEDIKPVKPVPPRKIQGEIKEKAKQPPPPPPIKQTQITPEPQYNHPTPQKNKIVPPRPQKRNIETEEKQLQVPDKSTYPQASQSTRQSLPVTKPPPPKRIPPPKKEQVVPKKVVQYDPSSEEEQEEVQPKKVNKTNPPPVQRKPPPKKPMVKQNPPPKQQEDDQEQYEQQQKVVQKPVRNIPPKVNKKPNAPPVRHVQKEPVQEYYEEDEEEEVERKIQTPKRAPPPPSTGGRRGPPPPRR